VASGGPIY